jgi:hypothetical protein
MDFFWLIIIFAICFALPDLLRKKRRYPQGRRPHKTGPMGTEPAPSSSPAKHRPIELKRKRQSVFTKAQPAEKPVPHTPIPAPAPSKPQAEATRPAPVPAPRPVSTAMQPEIPAAASVPVHGQAAPPPWSQLNPQAQQIYAGIVWSELLQPPVSVRRR